MMKKILAALCLIALLLTSAALAENVTVVCSFYPLRVFAENVLRDVPDIGIVQLTHRDVVRHELVQAIVRAYEKHAQKNGRNERQRRVFRP